VPVHYDPLVSKLVVWAEGRDEAIRRMRRAVAEYEIVGIKTTLPFLGRVLTHPGFVAGDYDTSFVEKALAEARVRPARRVAIAVVAAAIRALEERRARRPSPGDPVPAAGSLWRAAGLREAHGGRFGGQG
jgi:acetyl-CoA carboxylase biotin carboxylase subunit